MPQAVIGSVDLALAQLALAAEDWSGAERFASHAVTASRARDTPIFLGRELVRLAAARTRLGAAIDAIEPIVAEAVALAERTGADLIRQEAMRYGLVAS